MNEDGNMNITADTANKASELRPDIDLNDPKLGLKIAAERLSIVRYVFLVQIEDGIASAAQRASLEYADAVLIGRPFVPMVYGDGAQGVATYIEKIGSELRDTMAMCGVHTLGEITREKLAILRPADAIVREEIGKCGCRDHARLRACALRQNNIQKPRELLPRFFLCLNRPRPWSQSSPPASRRGGSGAWNRPAAAAPLRSGACRYSCSPWQGRVHRHHG